MGEWGGGVVKLYPQVQLSLLPPAFPHSPYPPALNVRTHACNGCARVLIHVVPYAQLHIYGPMGAHAGPQLIWRAVGHPPMASRIRRASPIGSPVASRSSRVAANNASTLQNLLERSFSTSVSSKPGGLGDGWHITYSRRHVSNVLPPWRTTVIPSLRQHASS